MSEDSIEHTAPTQQDVILLTESVYDLSALITEVMAPGLEKVQADLEKTREEKISRSESKARARRSIALVGITTLLALILNTFLVVGVIVPKCYNGRSFVEYKACDIIPGYKQVTARNRQLVDQFRQSQVNLSNEIQTTQQRQNINQQRLIRLENEDNLLRKRLGLPPASPAPHFP